MLRRWWSARWGRVPAGGASRRRSSWVGHSGLERKSARPALSPSPLPSSGLLKADIVLYALLIRLRGAGYALERRGSLSSGDGDAGAPERQSAPSGRSASAASA